MVDVIGDTGPAVLLLPGGAEAVDGFFPGLAEGLIADPGCRVLLYDRPGNGADPTPGGLREAADALHEAIAAAGAGPVIAIGQSLGGAAALLLATEHPDDVAGLVLLDPTPISDTALAAQVGRNARLSVRLFDMPVVGSAVRGMLRRSAMRSIRRHRMTGERRRAMLTMIDLDAAQLGHAVNGIEELSAALDLARVPIVPALVVSADRPRRNTIRRAHERLAAALNAPVRIWPKAEHAVHLTHADNVLDEARAIVRAVSAS